MSISTAIIPVRGGNVQPGDLETLAEAAQGAETFRIILIGDGLGSAAAQLDTSVTVELIEMATFAPLRVVGALAAEVKASDVILVPGSPDGRDLGAMLAAELGRPYFSPAMSVSVDNVVVARHAGNALAEIRPTGSFVAALQPGVRGVSSESPERNDIVVTRSLEVEETDITAVTMLEMISPDPETMELQEAPRIVGVGAGLLGEEGAAHRIEAVVEFGKRIGASMGATRVVTDAGFVGHDRQIGTTGVVVDPGLYVNFAISGAVQHTAGLGHPDHIISVNTDPHCPMMAMADLAVVSDARSVVEHLVELVSETGESDDV